MKNTIASLLLTSAAMLSSAAFADQWTVQLSGVAGVENYSGGGFITRGNMIVNRIVNQTVANSYTVQNYNLVVNGKNPNLECLNLLITAVQLNKGFHLTMKPDTAIALNPNVSIAANDIQSCGF